MSRPLVELCSVSCIKDDQPLFEDVNLAIDEGLLCLQ